MPDRPNVVVILSDQQRWDTLACYGNDWIQTPRLNRLAERERRIRGRLCLAACVRSGPRVDNDRTLSPLRRTGRQQDEHSTPASQFCLR